MPLGRFASNYFVRLRLTGPNSLSGSLYEVNIDGSTALDFTFAGFGQSGKATLTVQLSPNADGLSRYPLPRSGARLDAHYPAVESIRPWPARFETQHSLTLSGCGDYLVMATTASDCDFVLSPSGAFITSAGS